MRVLLSVLLLVSFPWYFGSSIATGQLIGVPGGEIFVQNYGTGPTVVFLSGYSFGASTWQKVSPAVSQFAHVVIYDRLDITGQNNPTDQGQSKINASRSQSPLTGREMISNLRTVLKKLSLTPPYTLVGHSYGGLLAQYFARKYPKEVNGIVLVDAPSQNTLRRLQKNRGGNYVLSLPDKSVDFYPEGIGMASTLDEMDQLPPFPTVPLMVIGAMDHNQPVEKQKQRLEEAIAEQKSLSALSPCASLFFVDTGHFVQTDRPWFVIDVIKQILKQIKTRTCNAITG